MEIIKNNDGVEYVVKIDETLVISASQFSEFSEKLEESLDEYRL